MKTLSIGFMILLLCSCGSRQEESRVMKGAALHEDSVMVADSLAVDSAEMRTLTLHIDQTFDDFVYAYTHDYRIQLLRTTFPLPYTTDSTSVFIQQKDWMHDHLYTDEEYYSMIFDKEEDMDIEKDLSVDKVNVSWLYLDKHTIRRYNFMKEHGKWGLMDINEHALNGNPNEAFLDFFYHFCNDSVFQRQHIESPLKFVTSDPDDDFNVLEAFIEVDQWFVFRPSLPQEKMTNINYGQQYDPKSLTKIVAFRAIGSGYSNTLFFRRTGTSWKLSAYEDLSN